jgi:hypothetical protein
MDGLEILQINTVSYATTFLDLLLSGLLPCVVIERKNKYVIELQVPSTVIVLAS